MGDRPRSIAAGWRLAVRGRQEAHLIERLLRNPVLYDAVQAVTGARVSERHVREALAPSKATGFILDAGGGTGIMARIFDRASGYCCMDLELDRVKIAAGRGSHGLVGDVTHIPIASATIDLVIQRAVSHHLTDGQFAAMTSETSRVLKENGKLLFLDATWAPSFIPGRLLWRVDQGSHPRSAADMRAVLMECFEIESAVTYSVFHRYLLAVARPRASGGAFR